MKIHVAQLIETLKPIKLHLISLDTKRGHRGLEFDELIFENRHQVVGVSHTVCNYQNLLGIKQSNFTTILEVFIHDFPWIC
jgi:hypothetical protein